MNWRWFFSIDEAVGREGLVSVRVYQFEELRRRWCRRVSKANGKGTRHQQGSRLGLLWDDDAREREMEESPGTAVFGWV